MHDAFLKSVFADRRMVEILIHGHAPEWAAKIDFSTLREESTGLVSKKTLQRRHPDMIWSADTVNGERVLFLLEFQRTVERLMALRTTTYTALTLEGVAAGPDFRPGDPAPGVRLSRPLPWRRPLDRTGPRGRLVPGAPIRVAIVWSGGERVREMTDRATISRRWSSAWPATFRRRIWPCSCRPCGALSRRTEIRAWMGFMVQTLATMLELRNYPERLMKGGAKTMAEVVDRFQQGMDELVQRGVRQGN